MTWLVESFNMQTEELLAEFDLDALAAAAVKRLIGERPEVLTSDQVRAVAPLFDIEPDRWESVTGASADAGTSDSDWLASALLHQVSTMLGEDPEDVVGLVYPMSRETAQGLLDRFSAGVRIPEGGVYIGLFGS